MEYLGLHNKSKAAVHPERKLTGPKKKKKKKKTTNTRLEYVILTVYPL